MAIHLFRNICIYIYILFLHIIYIYVCLLFFLQAKLACGIFLEDSDLCIFPTVFYAQNNPKHRLHAMNGTHVCFRPATVRTTAVVDMFLVLWINSGKVDSHGSKWWNPSPLKLFQGVGHPPKSFFFLNLFVQFKGKHIYIYNYIYGKIEYGFPPHIGEGS